MAVLQSLRSKVVGGIITFLIAGSLLSFIVDFNSLSSAINSTSSKYAVGKIDGKKVPYKDFQEQVEYQTSIAEIVGGTVSTDEQHKQIRDAAWQYFIDQNLFLKNASKAGIEVGKEELAEILGQQQDFVNLVQNAGSDQTGNLRRYIDYVQNNTYRQRFYAKYGSLFSSALICNDLELKDLMDGNNTSSTAQVVQVPFPYQLDSTINVSSSEIKKYYKEHKEQYKQVANREIEYALFEVTPSSDDIAAANQALLDVYDEFATTSNVKAFLMRNSDRSYSTYYYKAGELATVNKDLDAFVFGNNAGVSPVYTSGDEFYAVKVLDSKNLPDNVKVSHILGSEEEIDKLFAEMGASAVKFNNALESFAVAPQEGIQAGEIGLMSQSQMIPGMESVLTAELNKPFVLTTQYGKHIVMVTERNNVLPRKQVAILQKTAIPSKATMNEIYSKANTLATAAAGSLEKLQAAAKEQNVYLRPLSVTEATARYSAVDHAKEITRWVFDAKKGEASNVITVNQNYLFVVGVKDTHKEGYATVQEAASRIQGILYQQKLAEKTLADVQAKIAGLNTMEQVAEALGQEITVREKVGFASAGQMEPALAGAIAGAKEGVVTGPVKGILGVYIVNVTARNTAAFYTEQDAKTLTAQKAQYTTQMILPAMMESTNTVDNRERFF
ncbi:MAG: SurA N-terminal domain-containing protein [Bacteroidales bacterium]|nr:SurA N-terminal domain-containing protein [Bacteroidales bacterium]